MKKTSIAVSLVCAALLAACGDAGSSTGGGSASPSGSAKSATTGAKTADAPAEKKAKTKLTEAQLKEAYDTVGKENDFKKHKDMYVAKLGAPVKEEGDKSTWFGIGQENGKDKCKLLSASPTKGDEVSGTDDTNCWE